MNENDFYYLGTIIKPFSTKGSLLCFFDVDDIYEYENIKSVFIKIDNDFVPFMIDKTSIKDNSKIVLTFQDITDSEEIKKFIKSELYLPLSTLPKLTGNKFYFHEIINFKVIDENYGDIGVVEKILDYPHQAIMQVKFKDKEVLIPLTDNIIKNLDRKNNIINISAPDGLIEVYL